MNYKFFPNFATNISNNWTIIIFSGWNKFLRKLHFVILFVKICICKNTRSPTILSETRTILKILDDCKETQISHIFWARKSFKSSSTIRAFERKKEGSNKVAMRSQIFPANTNFPCYFWNIVRSEKMKRETIRGNMTRLTIADIIFFRLLHRIDLKLVHNIVDPSRFPPLFEDVTWT